MLFTSKLYEPNKTFCFRWTRCGIHEYVSKPGKPWADQECKFCGNLDKGYVQDKLNPLICTRFEPLSVGPAFPSDFVFVIILALSCCCCGGKVNKRPHFVKTPEMLEQEEEEKKRQAEEDELEAKKAKQKANNKKKETLKVRIRKYYNAKKQLIQKRFTKSKKQKDVVPKPPATPPPGFTGVVPAVSYNLVAIQSAAYSNTNTTRTEKDAAKRVASL